MSEIEWPDYSSDECGCDVVFRKRVNSVRPRRRERDDNGRPFIAPAVAESIVKHEDGRQEVFQLRRKTILQMARASQNVEYWQGLKLRINRVIEQSQANLAAIESGDFELPKGVQDAEEWRHLLEKQIADRRAELGRPVWVDTTGYHVRHGGRFFGTLVPCEKHKHISCNDVTSQVVPFDCGCHVRQVMAGEHDGRKTLYRQVVQLCDNHTVQEAIALAPEPNYGR